MQNLPDRVIAYDAGTSVALTRPVTSFELSIIYLACGAPFGVYYLVTSRIEKRKPAFALKLLKNFVFWPQYAVRLLVRSEWLRKSFDSYVLRRVGRDFDLDEKLRRVRKDLERIHLESNNPARIFEFREDFDRYAGLSVELSRWTNGDQSTAAEFQSAAGRRATDAISATWKRRNRSRLDAHRDLARTEFLSHFTNSGRSDPTIDTILADLLQTVGDEHFAPPDRHEPSELAAHANIASTQTQILDRAA